MKEKHYELKKVYDCQDMPNDVRKEFFTYMKSWCPGNDVYVEYYVGGCDFYEGVRSDSDSANVTDWLVTRGANLGEVVIIKHWR